MSKQAEVALRASERQVNLILNTLAKRKNKPLALMMLDLDKFKPANDLYGHPAISGLFSWDLLQRPIDSINPIV